MHLVLQDVDVGHTVLQDVQLPPGLSQLQLQQPQLVQPTRQIVASDSPDSVSLEIQPMPEELLSLPAALAHSIRILVPKHVPQVFPSSTTGFTVPILSAAM